MSVPVKHQKWCLNHWAANKCCHASTKHLSVFWIKTLMENLIMSFNRTIFWQPVLQFLFATWPANNDLCYCQFHVCSVCMLSSIFPEIEMGIGWVRSTQMEKAVAILLRDDNLNLWVRVEADILRSLVLFASTWASWTWSMTTLNPGSGLLVYMLD